MIRYQRSDRLKADGWTPAPHDTARCSVTDEYGRRCVRGVDHDGWCLADLVPPLHQGPAYGHTHRKTDRRRAS